MYYMYSMYFKYRKMLFFFDDDYGLTTIHLFFWTKLKALVMTPKCNAECYLTGQPDQETLNLL